MTEPAGINIYSNCNSLRCPVTFCIMRLAPSAKVWHDLRDVKTFNTEWFSDEFQKNYPKGLYLCSDIINRQWIYEDCQAEEKHIIYAAPTPGYNAVLLELVGDSHDKEPHGTMVDTAFYEADHRFEAADNAQELRDALPVDATVEEAVKTLYKTCKGCAALLAQSQK